MDNAKKKLPPGIREVSPGHFQVRVWWGFNDATGKPNERAKNIKGTLNDAKEARRKLLNSVDLGAAPNVKMTVAELFDAVIPHLAGLDRSEATLSNYRKHMDAFLDGVSVIATDEDGKYVPDPDFEDCEHRKPQRCTCKFQRVKVVPGVGRRLKVTKVTPMHVQAFYNGLALSGVTGKTITRYHATLRRSFNFAIGRTIINVNPCVHTERKPEVKKRMRRPSDAQVMSLITAGFNESWDLGVALHFTAAAGGRRGEVIAERWRNLDEDGLLSILNAARQLPGGVVTTDNDTKTHAERQVTLDEATVMLLAEHRSRMEKRAADAGVELSPDAFILSTSADGLEPWQPDRLTNAMKRLRKKSSFTGRYQDLRGWSAAGAFDSGAKLSEVVERGGWENSATFLEFYNRSPGDGDAEIAKGIGERMAAARQVDEQDELAARRARRLTG